MWRNTKRTVGDQLGLPQQTEHLLRLNFSPVEAYFYRKTHQDCLTKVITSYLVITRILDMLHLNFSHIGAYFYRKLSRRKLRITLSDLLVNDVIIPTAHFILHTLHLNFYMLLLVINSYFLRVSIGERSVDTRQH